MRLFADVLIDEADGLADERCAPRQQLEQDAAGGVQVGARVDAVRAAVDVPVLCKDFVVDPVQVLAARSGLTSKQQALDSLAMTAATLADTDPGSGLIARARITDEPNAS